MLFIVLAHCQAFAQHILFCTQAANLEQQSGALYKQLIVYKTPAKLEQQMLRFAALKKQQRLLCAVESSAAVHGVML